VDVTNTEREVVAALGETITRRIGEPRYNLWFANKTKFTHDGDGLVVGVANHFCREWLQKAFADDVRAAAAEGFGGPPPVRCATRPERSQPARREEPARPVPPPRTVSPAPAPAAPTDSGDEPRPPPAAPAAAKRRPRRWRHLQDFIVGSCNRVGYASA